MKTDLRRRNRRRVSGFGVLSAATAWAVCSAPRIDGKPGGIFLKLTTESGATLDFSHLGYD